MFLAIYKNTKLIGCSIYKEWKAIRYLNTLGNTIHKEREVLEDLRRDGRARCRSRCGPAGSRYDDDDDDGDDYDDRTYATSYILWIM